MKTFYIIIIANFYLRKAFIKTRTISIFSHCCSQLIGGKSFTPVFFTILRTSLLLFYLHFHFYFFLFLESQLSDLTFYISSKLFSIIRVLVLAAGK